MPPFTEDTAPTLSDAGLIITTGLTTPSRPGKAPRPVWTVTGNLGPWRSMLHAIGGRTYRGSVSFWTDPTDAITHAMRTTAPDSYTDQHEAKQARATARAERHTAWAQTATRRANAAFTSARAAVDGIPFGQPILVGHHSERRHRAALDRHDARMRRVITETATADYHRHRADAAERTASTDYTPAFCQRRITDAEKTIRDLDRRLARTADPTRADLYGTESAAGYRARLAPLRAEAIEKLDYWRRRLADCGGITYTHATIRPGDEVRPRSHAWARVLRCNPKTVSVTWESGALAGMTGKYPYAELTEHRRTADA
jgi:hypothetical protein